MADEPRKRSRFDKGDPEPARKSRFDRRSRSPAPKDSEPQRSRSPIAKSTESPAQGEKVDAAAAAAAAAAKINASISAKKGVQTVDVPPIRGSPSTPGPQTGGVKSPSAGGLPTPSGTLNVDIYQQDGDYIKDIEVNDLRNRYTLTKGSTQKQIKDVSGADVTTRGNYYPDKSMATPSNPPLYLHVTSTNKDGLEKAVKHIEELMKHELPNLIDERRFRPRRDREQQPEQPQVERDSLGRRKWPEERIPVDLEPIPGFNLRAQVVGAGGSFVKYIQQETRCRVQIKGRGSGFIEHDTNMESDEPMYLGVAGPDQQEVYRARDMCVELLASVRKNYEEFKESRNNRSYGGGGRGSSYSGDRGGGGGYQDRGAQGSYGGGSSYGGYGGGAQQQQPAYDTYGAGGAQSPANAQLAQAAQTSGDQPDPQVVAQAWVQYYTENPEADPYASYGGYAKVMQDYLQGGQQQQPQYQQYQQQAPGYEQAPGYDHAPGYEGVQNGGPPGAPPGMTQDEKPPPPPPPPGSTGPPGGSAGAYGSVPPPPGL